MPDRTGQRFGPYTILSPIGAGGMGEVYRARDTRLDREVALKLLPAESVPSPEALKRFEREAQAISRLSHPHVCTLFDVGHEGATPYLVMELVEGESLLVRLARGPLPLADVLRYGAEIAAALDAAHRSGIVHRDLKPGNVMLTRSGIKLLDFGLARSVSAAVEAPPDSYVHTLSSPAAALTSAGTVLGTLPYMAPEQLEGRPADARADIFALGAVLFEMATGRRAFAGQSAAAVMSAILSGPVPSLAAARAECPASVDHVVSGCLARDPDARWQSAHDVKLQLQRIAGDTEQPPSATDPPFARVAPWLTAALAIVLALALAVALATRHASGRAPLGTLRFQVPPPPGRSFAGWTEATTFAFSPDGRTLAFVAMDAGVRRLYLRPLATLESKPVEGTEGALSAFWSPDGRSIGFFADRTLKRLEVGTGAPIQVCSVRPGAGITGTWGAGGQILFASIEGEAIFSVSSAGGEPFKVAEPGPGTTRVCWPSFLPDGRRFLYLERRADRSLHVMLGEPGAASREVRGADSYAQYVEPGYLLFVKDGTLLAQRFDAATGAVAGEPLAIAEPVAAFQTVGWAAFAASANGTLAYAAPGDRARLVWFDRSGRAQPLESTASALWVRFSADGKSALFNRPDPRSGNLDIWALDLGRGVETRLTSDADTESYGRLLADGSLVYSAPSQGSPRLQVRDAAGGEPRPLDTGPSFQTAQDVTPDGRTLVYAVRPGYGAWDLFMVPLAGGPAQPLLQTPFDELDLRLSPDGRLAAFVSNEPGRPEVFIAPFPRLSEKVRVTQQGARAPRWSASGRELFYLTSDGRLTALAVRSKHTLELGKPQTLFRLEGRYGWADFDVSRDGRFLAVVPESLTAEQPLTVVVGALAEASGSPR
jgi:Tol biopolymer transport system component